MKLVKMQKGFHSFPFGKDINTTETDFVVKWSVSLFNHDLLDKLQSSPGHLMTFEMKAKFGRFEGGNTCDTPNVPLPQPTSRFPTIWKPTNDSLSKYVSQSLSILLQAPSINSVSTPTFHQSVNSPNVSPISKKEKSSKSTSKNSKAKSKSTKSV